MIDRPSNAFQFIDDVELEDQIFKRVYNRDEKSIDEYIVRQSNIDKFCKIEPQKDAQSPLVAKEVKSFDKRTDNLSDDHSDIDGTDNLDGSRDMNDEDSDGGAQ